jgi:hypothetical protein
MLGALPNIFQNTPELLQFFRGEEKMKRLSLIAFLVCLMTCSVANALFTWTGAAPDGLNLWSDPANWTDSSGNGLAPINTTDEARINNGTVNMDCDASVGLLRMCYAATTDVATLNLTASAGFTGKTLTVTKSSNDLFVVGYKGAATVNQDTGRVNVTNGSGAGAIRIKYTSTNPASFYNLSGGVMDTENLRGSDVTVTNLGLNDTGGTINLRTSIFRLGTYDGTVMHWTQGGSTLCPGGSIGNSNIGTASYETEWTTSAASKVQLELASDASYDTIHSSGNANLTLGILDIVASYTPLQDSFFDIIKLDLKTGKAGTGTFGSITDNLPGYFTAAWVNGAGTSDVLRVTYVPEPATVALLGLGSLIAVRRRKK